MYYNEDLVAREYLVGAVIKGKITNSSGNPVKEAKIDFCEKLSAVSPSCGTKHTDENGNYVLDVFSDEKTKLREGLYYLYIYPGSILNLNQEFKEINLGNREVKIVDITLKQCGSIAGRITNKEGNPIAEAWVYEVGFETSRYHVCESKRFGDCGDIGFLFDNEECNFYRKTLESEGCYERQAWNLAMEEWPEKCRHAHEILYGTEKCSNLGIFVIPYLEPREYEIGAFVKIGEKYIEIPPKEVKVELGKTAIVNFVFEE